MLESRDEGGRFSYAGASPRRAFEGGDPRPFMRAFLEERARPRDAELPPFSGGLVGFVGYDAVRFFEPKVALRAPRESSFPDAALFDFADIWALDHARERALAIGEGPERVLRALEREPAPLGRVPRASFTPRSSPREIERMVRAAKEHLERGDGQQIVLSNRFDAASDADPIAVYEALRAINPSPYMFLIKDGDRALVGASPETLVRVRGEQVTVRPIAGTRRRGEDDAEDLALEADLRASEKENAEHVMLVDLGRNDVGRVARVGSVEVASYKAIERYSHVMHMVSEVRGALLPNRTAEDAFAAAFPAGTLTGSPKVKAMQLIDSLEPARRGPYGGAIVALDPSGDLDSCITIRTLYFERGRVFTQAGAGVVEGSSPSEERDEIHQKARALVVAAGGA